MKSCLLIGGICAISLNTSIAQEQKGITFSGCIQSDILIPQADQEIEAEKTGDFLMNTYADLMVQSRHIDAGARLEYMEHPLPGFENDFKGWGIPHFWMKSKFKNAELTLGTFYEQFGSGFVLRSYEERSLGIDNSLLGAKLQWKPMEGIVIKALSGCQRRYSEWNKSLISGLDAELGLSQFSSPMKEKGVNLSLCASWVNLYENSKEKVYADASHYVNLPKFVNAWDLRAALDYRAWNILLEYSRKTDNPSYANGYIFRKGTAVMLSASYSLNGFSMLLQAKRSEDFSFKSTTDADKTMGLSSSINHMPAFTQEHTYTLAALYPYATQMADGEWAYQGEIAYHFRPHTTLGGMYGMNIKANLSYIRAIKRSFINGNEYNTLSGTIDLAGTDGYETSFFGWGDQTYYQDMNIQLSRRISKSFKLNLMYMNQRYNMTVIEGHGGMINSNIFIADGKYQVSPKVTLRGELQYLTTAEDKGDWLYALMELSLVPHWMITISDLYNAGETKTHYYQGFVTFSYSSHRLQLGYGRTKAGFNCSGGVCRYVPASKGLSLAYQYHF